MPTSAFVDEVVAGLRRRLALLGDGGDRRAIEDGIALLTDPRLRLTDGAQLETLLSTLREGRAPAGLIVLKPGMIADELARQWESHRRRPLARTAT